MFGIDDALLLAFVAAGSTAASVVSSQQAAGAQRKAMRLQRRQQALEEAKQKRDLIRQTRIAYATSQSNAENQGVASSSSALGGAGSIRSQMSGTMSFLDQYGQLSDKINSANMSASSWASKANLFSDVSSLAMMGAQNPDMFNSIFKKGPTP